MLFYFENTKLKTTLLREFGCHVQIADIFLKRGDIYIYLLFPSAASKNEYGHNPENFGRECFWCVCVCVWCVWCVCVCVVCVCVVCVCGVCVCVCLSFCLSFCALYIRASSFTNMAAAQTWDMDISRKLHQQIMVFNFMQSFF